MLSHSRHGSLFVFIGIFFAQFDRGIEAHAVRHIAIQRVMRTGLVGEHIWHDATARQLGNYIGAIANQADRNSFTLAYGIFQNPQGFVEVGDHDIAIASFDAALDALRVDVDAQKCRAIHGGRQWLRAAHAAHAAGYDQLASQISAKCFLATEANVS